MPTCLPLMANLPQQLFQTHFLAILIVSDEQFQLHLRTLLVQIGQENIFVQVQPHKLLWETIHVDWPKSKKETEWTIPEKPHLPFISSFLMPSIFSEFPAGKRKLISRFAEMWQSLTSIVCTHPTRGVQCLWNELKHFLDSIQLPGS